MENSKKLAFGKLTAYGTPGLGFGFSYMIILVYLPKFYTDTVGMSIGFIGFLLALSRVWDGINDPLIGILSDKTRSHWGRRRSWIAISSVLFAANLAWVLNPPISWPLEYQHVWLFIMLLLLFFVWSGLLVPYFSLAIDLSKDYVERTKLFVARGIMTNIGILCLPITMVLLKHSLGSDIPDSELTRFSLLSGIAAFVTITTALICVAIIKEPTIKEQQRSPEGFFSQFTIIKTNKIFRYWLVIFILAYINATSISALFLYFIDYVIQSEKGDMILGCFTLGAFIGIPLQYVLIQYLQKQYVILLSIVLAMVILAWAFTLGPGDEQSMFIIGTLLGCTYFPAISISLISMEADAIDYDEWQTGYRREATHVGVAYFLMKLAAAITIGIVYMYLGSIGYVSQAHNQPAEVITAL
ncbi:MAG: MFS transporter, partial [Coxiellaceae bacterium]|nr:MFS transporter [Coxiellaceae bacterium]